MLIEPFKTDLFLDATAAIYSIEDEDLLHMTQPFFAKNGHIRLAAKKFLDQAELATNAAAKFEALKNAFALGSTEAGLKMAVHEHLLGYDNTQARIAHIIQTCQLIQAIPKTDPYYQQFWNHNFPEMIFLLMWALEDADNIEEFKFCDQLIGMFKCHFDAYLDAVFFPCTQFIAKSMVKQNRAVIRKHCIEEFNLTFAYQMVDSEFPTLSAAEKSALAQAKLPALYAVYEDLAYWLANLIYGVDFETNYIKRILGENYAQKIFLIQQALQFKQYEAKNSNQKLEIDRIEACISYLKFYQLYDQFASAALQPLVTDANTLLRKMLLWIKAVFSRLFKSRE